MITMRKIIYCLGFALSILATGCNDFLDKEPLSDVTPENYLLNEADLAAYVFGMYPNVLPSHEGWTYGMFEWDKHTDNMANLNYSTKFVPGQYQVPHSETTNWNFNDIYKLNYFISNVLPKYETGSLTGNLDNIKYSIGEVYFMRAYEYFIRYQKFGDFPIVTEPLKDDLTSLVAASKREPRNEVARFILSDLDKAIEMMGDVKQPTTRISADLARLLKSRVALFEGTWLKYFKGTAFVPNGEGWPGKDKNPDYAYPAGDIDNEITYFLDIAMKAGKEVGDKYVGSLTENTGKVQQSLSEPENPYMEMFSAMDMSGFSEVLLWREYNLGLNVYHNVPVFCQTANGANGTTRGMVNTFIMQNGLPIYAEGSGYKGDNTIADVRKDRDTRLSIFLKEPGQKNIMIYNSVGTHYQEIEPYPLITNTTVQYGYNTGYALRKGWSYDQGQCINGRSYTGCPCFRAAEALLNYMEASYELTGQLDQTARQYWSALRTRSKVDADFQKTIDNTDMTIEAQYNWGAYSVGKLVDPVLYNIRRERNSEFMAEGLRNMDLIRWRAMDQMIDTPYHIEGMHLYNTPMEDWYTGQLLNDESDKANVSSPARSEYIRPYEKNKKSMVYDGYRWAMAHYLSPLPIKQFQLTSSNDDLNTSPLYQNPGWPLVAGEGAEY